MVLDCWTDGSCIESNGGWSFLVKNGNEIICEANGIVPNSTNNIAELTAIQRLLRSLPLLNLKDINEIKIYTDSSYCIGVIDHNYKIYKNKEIITDIKKDLALLRQQVQVNFIIVKRRRSTEAKFVDFSANQRARKLKNESTLV